MDKFLSDYELVGEVKHYYKKLGVVVVRVIGGFKKKDRILFIGPETDYEIVPESMEVKHKKVNSVRKGQDVGIKIDVEINVKDQVFRKK
jgi:hypothetical protein